MTLTRRFQKGMQPPLGGDLFRKMTNVRMWRQDQPFVCESREGELRGEAGDYLAQDGHGGFYPISAEFHDANYVRVSCPICHQLETECGCSISAGSPMCKPVHPPQPQEL